jgi:hypothetical protein
VKIHTLVPQGIAHIRGIFQEDQIRIYTKERNAQLFGIIQFGYLERQYLLSGIGPHCIDTWVPRTTKRRIITVKIIRTILPEYFGKILSPPVYRVLSEEEYI